MGGLITKGHHVINPGHDTSRIVEVTLCVSRSHGGHAPENVWIGAQELIRPYSRQRSCHSYCGQLYYELAWTFLLACLFSCLVGSLVPYVSATSLRCSWYDPPIALRSCHNTERPAPGGPGMCFNRYHKRNCHVANATSATRPASEAAAGSWNHGESMIVCER